ncbi:MAG: hypothetical protein CSA35_08105 [Dethiosulfovibrio peptidovorans]|nr:MAG: hypothetical protein CSA35_08105 [Dethiosulfovibrio peptidovorans]
MTDFFAVPLASMTSQSRDGDGVLRYDFHPEIGEGQVVRWDGEGYSVLVADFTPKRPLWLSLQHRREYMEISRFDAISSSIYIGKGYPVRAPLGLSGYTGTEKPVRVFSPANRPVRFVKLRLMHQYWNHILSHRYGAKLTVSRKDVRTLAHSSRRRNLALAFDQLRDLPVNGDTRGAYIDAKTLEILSLIAGCSNEHKKRTSSKITARDRHLVQEAWEHMIRTPADPPSTADLARSIGMSVSRFYRVFRELQGGSPYERFQDFRMDKALLLLREDEASIQQIAESLGYRNPGYFAGLFKKTHGLSPRDYRALIM